MKIYDLSLTITPDLPVWPGDPAVQLERISKIEDGQAANVSRLETGVHVGTHVDAPYHFLANGKTIETLPLDALIGPAWVVEIPADVTIIDAQVLSYALPAGPIERILFKTTNSALWQRNERAFQTEFVAVQEDAAQELVKRGVRLVGIDYLSISPFHHSIPTHVALLTASVVILEGLNLADVPAGQYELYCLPLKLGGSDGAPARAVLIQR